MRYVLNTELSERELGLIGSVVAQWGFLENDIFEQTLLTFEDEDSLPSSMIQNAQFSEILKLWLRQVVEKQSGARKAVLLAQYEKILSLNEYRQAVVHSRWEWRPQAPDEIVAVRIHKKTIKRVRFSVDDLLDFSSQLGEVRFWLRYPSGAEDQAEEMAKLGGYISRRGWEMFADLRATDTESGSHDDKHKS